MRPFVTYAAQYATYCSQRKNGTPLLRATNMHKNDISQISWLHEPCNGHIHFYTCSNRPSFQRSTNLTQQSTGLRQSTSSQISTTWREQKPWAVASAHFRRSSVFNYQPGSSSAICGSQKSRTSIQNYCCKRNTMARISAMVPRPTTTATVFFGPASTTNGFMCIWKRPCAMTMAFRMKDRELKKIQSG